MINQNNQNFQNSHNSNIQNMNFNNLNNTSNFNNLNNNKFGTYQDEEKKDQILTAVLIGLIVIIVLILGYIIYNSFVEREIVREAEQAVEQFEQNLTKANEPSKPEETLVGGFTPISNEDGIVSQTKTRGSRVKLGNYDVVGTLRIPKTGIKYPILSPSDATSLEKGLTLLETTRGVNMPGNTTILGHNYRNNMFFSKNHTLQNGDKIYIKGLDGVEVEYTIYEGSMKKPDDAGYMRRDVGNNTEISLSTCNTDSSLRYVILAKKTGE